MHSIDTVDIHCLLLYITLFADDTMFFSKTQELLDEIYILLENKVFSNNLLYIEILKYLVMWQNLIFGWWLYFSCNACFLLQKCFLVSFDVQKSFNVWNIWFNLNRWKQFFYQRTTFLCLICLIYMSPVSNYSTNHW